MQNLRCTLLSAQLKNGFAEESCFLREMPERKNAAGNKQNKQ